MLDFPLPLPRSIQEIILAKLPLEDLLRSRAVCRYWRRIASTKSFQRRYGATIIASKPWFMWMHARVGLILVNNSTGRPYLPIQDPWIPTSKNEAIVSTSRGLLLINNTGASFTVVNPIIKSKVDLPVLELSSGQDIAYSVIHCSAEDSSYKVFILGVMDSDELSGILYKINIAHNPSDPASHEDIHEYKKPFMQVYSSTSGSWSPINSKFPSGFVLPHVLHCKSHQSLIANEVIYCITNSDLEIIPQKIARFDIGKMEWNPVMVKIPDEMILFCLMKDSQEKLMLVGAIDGTRQISRAAINEETNKVVIGNEINLPREVHPQNRLMCQLMEVWGYGDTLVFHVPVRVKNTKFSWEFEAWDGVSPLPEANIDGEHKVWNWYFDLETSRCFRSSVGVDLPFGAFASRAADLLKMPFFPSLRVL